MNKIFVLVVLILASCQAFSGSIEGGDLQEDYVPHELVQVRERDYSIYLIISSKWSVEQQQDLIDAIDFWKIQINDSVQFRITTSDCTNLDKGCIMPVPDDAELLRSYDDIAGGHVVGLYAWGDIYIAESSVGEHMTKIAAHEIGHYLGLHHDESGIMFPYTGGITFELGEATEQVLRNNNLL